jgi:hypothetical protein
MIIRNVSDKRNSRVVPAICGASMLKGYVTFKQFNLARRFASLLFLQAFKSANFNFLERLKFRHLQVPRAKSPCITMGFGNVRRYLWSFCVGGDA